MRQILFASHTAPDIAAGALDAIVTAARRNNAALGLSGRLLHIEGGFLQLLEGEDGAVEQVYDKIRADTRHWDVRLLLDRPASRAFADWGFERLTGNDPETAGIFAITDDAIADRLSPGAGRIVALMLETFYRVQSDDAPDLKRSA